MLARVMLAAALVATAIPAYPQAKSKILRAGHARIPNEYIVVFEDDVLPEHVPALAKEVSAAHGTRPEKVWHDAIKGFYARMPEARAEALSRNPRVKYVEENAHWYLSAQQQTSVNPATCDPTAGTCSGSDVVTDNRLWHLDRLDQNYAAPTNTFAYCTTGSNKYVYVVDSGVMKYHQEFGPSGARVMAGKNASGDMMPADDPCMGFATWDANFNNDEVAKHRKELGVNGHGTAVASLVAGKRIGVAKNASIVPVKVIRCAENSARRRLSSHEYQSNETIYRKNGVVYRYYRARNTGVTGATAPDLPTTVGATVWDGNLPGGPEPLGVEWEYVGEGGDLPEQTTQMIVDGLNWIKSAENTNPKAFQVVTLSIWTPAIGDNLTPTVESVIRELLEMNMTVVASANNQNHNACNTSPARMGQTDDLITVGGAMIANRPWNVDNIPAGETEANGGPNINLLEPGYDATVPVRDARWICGPGDSSICSNTLPTDSHDPNQAGADGYQGGSNGGPCVTLFAPAKNVIVASNTASDAYRDARISGGNATGTSWSAPIAAGYAARILQNNSFTPAGVRSTMIANSVATLDTATLDPYDHNGVRILGTPNRLLRLGDVNISDPPDSITTSTATTLTVVANGTSTLTYQWYEVNSGFDHTTYPYGAHSSTLIAGATSASYQVSAPTQEKAYWVRVKGSCGSADSTIAVVTPITASAPTSVVATAVGGSVTITWTPSNGAEGYDVEANIDGAGWGPAVHVNGETQSSASHTPASSTGVALYRVRATVGLGQSGASNHDVAYVGTFAEGTITNVPASVPIRAEHITQIRSAVNVLRQSAGLSTIYSSDDCNPALVQGQPIDDAHWSSLMSNLSNARLSAGVPSGWGYRSPTPDLNVDIYRTHLEDLRRALQ